jgi:glycosyltransferase involved in cell wall biosynthesis
MLLLAVGQDRSADLFKARLLGPLREEETKLLADWFDQARRRPESSADARAEAEDWLRSPNPWLVWLGLYRLREMAALIPPRPQAELVPLYHAADALVLPSRSEGGLPLVVQEALACGLPVLLSEDVAFSKYKGCTGLSFCPLTPDAVRSDLLRILSGREPTVGIKSSQNDPTALDAFLPDETWWLKKLYSII